MIKIIAESRRPVANYFRHIAAFDNESNRQSIDLSHNALLFGAVLSAKPTKAVELGVGTGYASFAVLHAMDFNGCGSLTCVDSGRDWGGTEPPVFERLRAMGAETVLATEKNFTLTRDKNSYDFLVSDADHRDSHLWLLDTLAMMAPGSLMFFHDTNSLPGMMIVEESLRGMGLSCFHFKKNSRIGERCERGWLMAVKGHDE